jgi:hypothetical protein
MKNTYKKSNKKNKNSVEDDDDGSCFSQLSTIMPQPEAELPQISRLPSLNSDECSSAIAIDVSRKKKKKKAVRSRTMTPQYRYSLLVSWCFHHFSMSQCSLLQF